jgi:hypothetical protein
LLHARWRGTAGEASWCWILAGRGSGTELRADWTGTEGKKQEMKSNKSERAVPEILTSPVAARNLAGW